MIKLIKNVLQTKKNLIGSRKKGNIGIGVIKYIDIILQYYYTA